MALQNFLRQLGWWTTVEKWREPLFYRVRLKQDLLLRLLIGFAVGAAATCLLLVLFAINVRPPSAAYALFGMLLLGGLALLLLLHGSGTASGSVRICQEGISRKRNYAGFTVQWVEDANWPYDSIEQCVLVPGQSIRQPFSLLFLASGDDVEMIGVPGRVDLPRLAQFLSSKGLVVKQASYVPQQYTHGLNLPVAAASAVLGGLLLIGGLGFYLVKVAPWRQPAGPVADRPVLDFPVPAPPRFQPRPALLPEAQAQNAAVAPALPAAPAAEAAAAIPPAVPAAVPRAASPPRAAPPASPPSPSPGKRARLVGGSGGIAFQTSHPQQQPAIGFRYALGTWADVEGLSQLQPLYAAAPAGPNQVVARDGYVVAGLEVDAKQFVRAVRVIFARKTADGQIDPADTYHSPWLGTPTDQPPQTLLAAPAPVIGVHGRRGALIDALGLVTAPAGDP